MQLLVKNTLKSVINVILFTCSIEFSKKMLDKHTLL